MLIIRILAQLPFWLLYPFASFLYYVAYYIIRYRLKTVRRNLSNSFPEKSKTELLKIEKQFYRNLTDYVIETLKLYSMSEQEFRRRILVTNPELIKQKAEQYGMVLLLGSHHFNWEWKLTTSLLHANIPMDFVYQRQKNKTFDNFLLHCRSRFGGSPVYRESVARELIKKKGQVRGLIMASDQYPGRKGDKKFITTFLNQETRFFDGMNQIARLTQACTLFIDISRLRRGYFSVTYSVLTEPPYDTEPMQVAGAYANALEKEIVRDPANWLWSHKRWRKPKKI